MFTFCLFSADTTSGAKQREKKKKPYRPCPYCHAFKSALSDHIKRCHSKEEVVKKALLLRKSNEKGRNHAAKEQGRKWHNKRK